MSSEAVADSRQAMGASNIRWVGFVHAGQRYAVDARHVLGVLQDLTVTSVPGAHDALLGVAPFRGEVVPVIETSRILDGGVQPCGNTFVLSCHGHKLALPVEKVLGALDLPAGEGLVDDLRLTGKHPYFSGVRLLDDALVVILAPDGLCDVDGKLLTSHAGLAAGS